MTLKHQQTQFITEAPHALPPTISIAFGAALVPLNGTTTLVFTITNPNLVAGLTGIAFTDNLPAGLVVNNVPGVVNACGGTVVAAALASSINAFGINLVAGASCTITVTVKGVAVGIQFNTTDPITSREGGTGLPSNTISLEVVAALAPIAAIIGGSVKLIDVSNPAAPFLASSTVTNAQSGDGEAMHIDNANHRAFVLSGPSNPVPNSLQILDISNRAAPAILSTTACGSTEAGQYTMVISGHFLILVRVASFVSLPDTMEVFDISNPAAPFSAAIYNLTTDFAVNQGNATGALLQGAGVLGLAAMGNPITGALLGFYDISALPVITQIAVTNVQASANILFQFFDLLAGLAYVKVRDVGAGINEIRIYDTAILAAPALLGTVAIPGSMVNGSNVANGKLYGCAVLSLDKNLYLFDVSNPAAPVLVSTTAVVCDRNFNMRGAGDKCYLATRLNALTNYAVRIFDTTVPAAPTVDGTVIYQVSGGSSQLHLDL